MRSDHKDADYLPAMPELQGHEQVLSYLWDAGPVMAGGMAAAPLSHQEIAAWAANTHTPLTGWEAQTLRRASVEYAAESEAARDAARPMPYAAALTHDERAATAARVEAAFAGLLRGGAR